ncbi:proline-rich protein 36-like [Loxodonta africana]|uniref:proline-rich protein 36-like n=1 Tax=Loxodonta africana TaxID=9785 RepID=UPI0030D0A895
MVLQAPKAAAAGGKAARRSGGIRPSLGRTRWPAPVGEGRTRMRRNRPGKLRLGAGASPGTSCRAPQPYPTIRLPGIPPTWDGVRASGDSAKRAGPAWLGGDLSRGPAPRQDGSLQENGGPEHGGRARGAAPSPSQRVRPELEGRRWRQLRAGAAAPRAQSAAPPTGAGRGGGAPRPRRRRNRGRGSLSRRVARPGLPRLPRSHSLCLPGSRAPAAAAGDPGLGSPRFGPLSAPAPSFPLGSLGAALGAPIGAGDRAVWVLGLSLSLCLKVSACLCLPPSPASAPPAPPRPPTSSPPLPSRPAPAPTLPLAPPTHIASPPPLPPRPAPARLPPPLPPPGSLPGSGCPGRTAGDANIWAPLGSRLDGSGWNTRGESPRRALGQR